jgi:hypothetical protein
MLMKCSLRIDDEFKRLVPPLSGKEYSELETSLLKDGCRDPIVIWEGTILDGHNRYLICLHHDLSFQVHSLKMEGRDEAIAWICTNQIGRRNINEATRQYLIGKRFEAERRIGAMNPTGYNQYVGNKLSPQNEGKPLLSLSKHGISSKIGKEYGVSHSTVERYGQLAYAVDRLGSVSEKIANGILSGTLQVMQHDIIDMVDLNDQQIKAVARDIPQTDCYRLERKQIIDSIRTVKRPTVPSSHHVFTEMTAVTVKDMPDYDPDAEVASLTLTMPSWRSSINRVRLNSNVVDVSEKAKTALLNELTALVLAIDMMVRRITEE